MKLFQNLFAKGGIVVGAPIAGKLVSIKEVSDPTFGDEILGKGAAIIPSGNQVYAPVDGKVGTAFPTGHAVAIVASDGEEILIHVGLDTVKLNGQHFTVHVKEGQEVKNRDNIFCIILFHFSHPPKSIRKYLGSNMVISIMSICRTIIVVFVCLL